MNKAQKTISRKAIFSVIDLSGRGGFASVQFDNIEKDDEKISDDGQCLWDWALTAEEGETWKDNTEQWTCINAISDHIEEVTIEYTNGDFCIYGKDGILIEDNNPDYATAERWASEEGYEVRQITRTEQYEMYIQYCDECIEENKMPIHFVAWREENKLPNL